MQHTIGENGSLEYTADGVGSDILALFFALVRGIDKSRIELLMESCMSNAVQKDDMMTDLFVLTMQTRDCRGGKGERDMFYNMIMWLYQKYPDTVVRFLPLLGEYGYYKDFFRLIKLSNNVEFHDTILNIVAAQIKQDEMTINAGGNKLSLCAKYCPREGKGCLLNKTLFNKLVNKLYPDDGNYRSYKQNKKQYRQLISKLSAILDVPEIKMCGKRFSELDFAKVPSLCTKKFSKAFLNEKVKGKVVEQPTDDLTGNRYPDDSDRVTCRAHIRDAMKENKINGKQLFPHDIVETICNKVKVGTLSSTELELYNCQWTTIRDNLRTQLMERGGSDCLGKLVPMSDVSGSMAGTPMYVSIALGILISEINHPAFRDRILTFDSNTQWIQLNNNSTIYEKVIKTMHSPWGMSTDITKAFGLICDTIRKHRLLEKDVPNLIILSDMQFDCATGNSSQTQLKTVQDMFRDVGMEVAGVPYSPPRIIFWNLRGNTNGFPAQTNDKNVQMLSGFSPTLLKSILVNDVMPDITPYNTLREILDSGRYNPVRDILNEKRI